MDWTALGHASWLAEAGGERIVFDPLLGETHHDGVFVVVPPRRIDVDALRPDRVVVSHRHPDHFDLPSLARLLAAAPEARLITADALVARAAKALGYRQVDRVDAGAMIDLGDVRLYTTPSFCKVVEWGMIVVTRGGAVWNQVDTELRSPQDVRAVLGQAAAALGVPPLAEGPTLGIVRWNPLKQVEAVMAGDLGFPTEAWMGELSRAVALGAKGIIPGAAGTGYAPAHAWMDRLAYPASESMFLRDLAAALPDTPTWRAVPGHRWRVSGGRVEPLDAPSALVEPVEAPDPRGFRPFVLPDVEDPNPRRVDERLLRARVEGWVRGTLARALTSAWRHFRLTRPAVFALEVVHPSGPETWSLVVDGTEPRVRVEVRDDWDALAVVAASVLVDVIDARSHWGRALLGGHLRTCSRAVAVDAKGVRPARVPGHFLYLALPYDQSTERWVDRQLVERPWA